MPTPKDTSKADKSALTDKEIKEKIQQYKSLAEKHRNELEESYYIPERFSDQVLSLLDSRTLDRKELLTQKLIQWERLARSFLALASSKAVNVTCPRKRKV